jgi:hypothetical protein
MLRIWYISLVGISRTQMDSLIGITEGVSCRVTSEPAAMPPSLQAKMLGGEKLRLRRRDEHFLDVGQEMIRRQSTAAFPAGVIDRTALT